MLRILLLALTLSLTSCGNQSQPQNIKNFSPEDQGMNAAMQRARDEIATLTTRLNQPVTDADALVIKVALPTQDSTKEHIWCGRVTHANGSFSAFIDNVPRDKQYKLGQPITVKLDQISDWMYVENGKLVGGYTLRHHYSTLTEAEKVEFRKNLPFRLE